MVQFPRAARQAIADFTKRLGSAELAEEHADKLIPARKSLCRFVSMKLANRFLESMAIDKGYDLRKQIRTFERHKPLRMVEHF
jgi:hypothetical protein